MQNGDSEPQGLLERIRNEVRKRRLALEPAASGERPHSEVSAAISAAPPEAPQASASQPEEKPRLKRARIELDRASSKNVAAPGWPRFLRGLRRNQGAINEALLRVVDAFLETLEWLQKKAALMDSRFADLSRGQQEQRRQLQQQLDLRARQITEQGAKADAQHQQLAELDRRLEQQARQATEDEVAAAQQRQQLLEVERRLGEHAGEQQKQLLDLNYKLLAYQTKIGEGFERAGAQQFRSERELIDLQRQLRELQDFVNAQQQQNGENAGLLREQQEQLTELRGRLEWTAEARNKLEEVSGQLIEYQNDACARYHLTIEALEREMRRVAEVRSRVEELKPGAFSDSSAVREIEVLRDKINAMQTSFTVIEKHLARPDSTESLKAIAPAIKEEIKEHEADAFYLAFENQFRGSRELIKGRLRFYLPIIERVKIATGDALAVDLGCGRGEWLELLQEHGYEGVGVDLNRCMIEECRSRGLKAESADAIAYLRSLASGSVSLITGFHIVEHLSFSQLVDLFQETFRVLCSSGTAIFETPNPETTHVTGYSFYLDPTHRNPIPQELLCFIGRQAGFDAIQVERLQAYLEDSVFKGYLDYAGIFTK